MLRLGFIGIGTIAEAFISGLRRVGNTNPILLSPRSEQRSRALTERFADLRRAASNADVVAESDIVFLAMRPAQVEEALAGVRFRKDHVVASFVTGLLVPDLAALAPGADVARILPLPMVAKGQGPVICYPSNETLLSLLEGMGDVVVPQREAELLAMGAVSGFMSTFFELEQALADWLVDRGVASSSANLYVRSMLYALAEKGRTTPDGFLGALPGEFETKGGLNERTRATLKASQWFDAPGLAFGEIGRLDRRSLK
ncbi:MAG: NAD(P)-binding domain-containing protein [Alphaproteobacteria bacterium]|nr:NAD(P)-binding domain-containing protein [Alphaproteobacteria bacterium]